MVVIHRGIDAAHPRRLAFYCRIRASNDAIIAVTSLVSGDHDWLKRHDPVILPPDVTIFRAYFA